MKDKINRKKNSTTPDKNGFFGNYGGQFVPEELKKALEEVEVAYLDAMNNLEFKNKYKQLLEVAYLDAMNNLEFKNKYKQLLKDYVGRPSPLFYAKNLTKMLGGAKIYLKREDLNHTGAHKINHTLGEALLAKRMGKKKLIAETGAGQHGVALATAAALTGLECEIHMGEIDIKKQNSNVARMKMLGTNVVSVNTGGRCLKDAVDSAFDAFIKDYKNTFFGIGSVVGPHPYPMMVRDFQSIVGEEAKIQIIEKEGRLPDYLIACVGGGSNAMGLFNAFLNDHVKMIGVEPSGKSLNVGEHAATLTLGTPGTLHGMFTYLLQDEEGLPLPVHSIASGLDYPGVGPQHSFLKDEKRVKYVYIDDNEALDAFTLLSKTEGIIPALESSHAIAYITKLVKELKPDNIIIANLSGRGDKDLDYIYDKIN